MQYPVLLTPSGVRLAESEAIAKYLADGSPLYPISNVAADTTKATIDQWIDWAKELTQYNKYLIYPIFGEPCQIWSPLSVITYKAVQTESQLKL